MSKLNLGNGKYVTVNKKFDTDIYCHTIVCFDDNFSVNNFINGQLQEGKVSKIIVVGSKPQVQYSNNVVFTHKLTKRLLKDSEQVFFMVNVDTDEFVINNLIRLKDICDELAIPLGLRIKMDIVLGNIIKDDSDMVVTLKALFTTNNLRSRYEMIYDYICDNLDELFQKNNFCQFENDKCIYNRHDKSEYNVMGCCYSFKYHSLLGCPVSFYDISLCKHLRSHSCSVKCLGCKLFTCKYLRKRGIVFKLDYMVIAKGFFTKGQRELLRTTFFVTKEEVLDKLMKKCRG
ncbi:MAG: hypothetical protein IJS47_06640 [Clostridia bacterium]|nr:hypothetical protein [Clostridia bacterium]